MASRNAMAIACSYRLICSTALRQRDLDSVAKAMAAETGMVSSPLVDGERITGVYRRMVVTWRADALR